MVSIIIFILNLLRFFLKHEILSLQKFWALKCIESFFFFKYFFKWRNNHNPFSGLTSLFPGDSVSISKLLGHEMFTWNLFLTPIYGKLWREAVPALMILALAKHFETTRWVHQYIKKHCFSIMCFVSRDLGVVPFFYWTTWIDVSRGKYTVIWPEWNLGQCLWTSHGWSRTPILFLMQMTRNGNQIWWFMLGINGFRE